MSPEAWQPSFVFEYLVSLDVLSDAIRVASTTLPAFSDEYRPWEVIPSRGTVSKLTTECLELGSVYPPQIELVLNLCRGEGTQSARIEVPWFIRTLPVAVQVLVERLDRVFPRRT